MARSVKVKVNGFHWRKELVVGTERQFVFRCVIVQKTSALNSSESDSVKTRRPQLERQFSPPQSESSLVSGLLDRCLVIRDQSINSE